MALEGQAWCVMVRSPYAHGVIRGIGVDAARAMPGVLGVFTAADMAEYGPMRSVLPLKNKDGTLDESTFRYERIEAASD